MEKKKHTTLAEKTIKVLHVDDQADLLDLTRAYLEKISQGTMRVDSLVNPKQVFAQLEEQEYDVIIADYQMPGMDGLELLRRLRNQNNEIPFIMFTGRSKEEIAITALNLGADYYLKKEGEPKALYIELLYMIKKVVRQKRLEQALKASECKFRTIVEHSYDGILLTDEQGTIIEWNQAMERLTGRKKEEMLGQTAWDAQFELGARISYTPQVYEQLKTLVQTILKTGQAPQFGKTAERTFVHPDGTQTWGESLLFPIRTHRGFMIGTIIRDITARKQVETALHESEKKYQIIFESDSCGICILHNNQILDCNQKIVELFKYPKDQIIGAYPWEGSPHLQPDGRESKAKALEKIRAALSGVTQHFGWTHRQATGTLFHTEVRLKGFDFNGNNYVLAILGAW